MEKAVIFRDYQEAQTADFNDIQTFARQSFDDLVNDAVTNSLRYTGFNTVKSNTAEVTTAPGRFYGANANGVIGAVFTLTTSTIISLVQYLAVSQQRILTLVAYGVENQVDVQTRDFLTNTTTLQTEPQAVAMTDSRDAVLAIVAGAESGSPTPPAIGTTQVAIANILMSNTGVVSVTMNPAALVTSTEDLDERVTVIETFDAQVGPRINALAADLAALANALAGLANQGALIEIIQDVAQLKTKVGLPSTYAQYGASYYLWPDPTDSDVNNTQSLGFNAALSLGIRFPAQNEAIFALSLFNSLDPNAAYSGGLLLPAYTSVLILQTGTPASTIPLGQYGYQTYALVEQDIAYSRIRDGGGYAICTNGAHSQTTGDTTVAWWLPNFSTYETVVYSNNGNPNHYAYGAQYYWHDSWTEPYWSLDTVNHSINGAQIAQTFLVSSDTWITQLGIDIATVASATDVCLTLCKCTNGQPDLTKVISHNVIPGASLVTNWNVATIAPAFCAKGDRMAVVVTSAANHQIGMAPGGSYLDGTFMYTIDGTYFLGDFTKEIALLVYGAKFASSQVVINLGGLNLAGGIRDIDLTARMIVPASCQLVFEVLPVGTGTWLPIQQSTPLVPFANAPVQCSFRARFIGTPDIAPGIVLSDSICNIWCPGPTFTYVSAVNTLLSNSSTISLKIRVENWNLTAHSIDAASGPGNGSVKLYFGNVGFLPTAISMTLVDPDINAYEFLCTWTIPTLTAGGAISTGSPNITMAVSNPGTVGHGMAVFDTTNSQLLGTVNTYIGTALVLQGNAAHAGSGSSDLLKFSLSSFTFVIVGTTNSVADTFLVADTIWWAL